VKCLQFVSDWVAFDDLGICHFDASTLVFGQRGQGECAEVDAVERVAGTGSTVRRDNREKM
jgi:hypothetical protein